MTSIEQLEHWLKKPEEINLEFKEAKNDFDRQRKLPDYCAAIANEGGGKLILGVNNKGQVIGTKAFDGTHNKQAHDLLNKLKIRVEVEELKHPNGRVLIFHIPGRQIGQIVKSTGDYKYPMRVGESLAEMDLATIKKIINETEPDFSAKIVPGLTVSDLDEEALLNFKKRWAEKAKREDYLSFSNDKLLRSIGLLSDEGLNYASLILFGKKEKIDKLLPGSEIIFEWRQNQANIPHDYRKNWREPFFKVYDDIWKTINDRNLRYPFQDGLFQKEIYAFNEKSVREAVLNAVAHRDYNIENQSIFIRASSEKFIIESPGGFPADITPENILNKTYWRNRSIAETFEKAGFVERSGQGMDDIFGNTIKEGKGLPDLSKSDAFSVQLIIPAQVKDKNFVLFLEKIISQKQISFSFEEIYELEKIREIGKVKDSKFKKRFLELGIIEQIGQTRGAKYILSHQYYAHRGKVGVHTRLIGISRDKQKELIIKHLEKNKKGKLNDFRDIFPEIKPMDISNLLRELRQEKKIVHEGSKSTGYWKLA